jgi:hypothetical protein
VSVPAELHGAGWIAFAGVMFLIVGTFNVIAGVAALADDDYFKANELLFGDLSFWGLSWITLGASQILTSYLIFKRSGLRTVPGRVPCRPERDRPSRRRRRLSRLVGHRDGDRLPDPLGLAHELRSILPGERAGRATA